MIYWNYFKKSISFSLGFILIFSILGLVYSVGFHPASEIVSGTFSGNYSFMNGNVGIGTTSPSGILHTVTSTSGSYAGVHFVDNGDGNVFRPTSTNSSFIGSVVQPWTSKTGDSTFSMITAVSGNGGDVEFRVRGDGVVTADGSITGGGADYAEWFLKEENISSANLVGLNLETGKVRNWQFGDPLIGIQSTNPGFIGNNPYGAEDNTSLLNKTHVLVALVGQVELNSLKIVENNRRVETVDGQFIGYRLNTNKVFIK